MERPREMSSSTGISEISESTDELDLVYRPKGLPRIRCQPNERIVTCRDEDELCQLIEVLDRQSARIRGFQQQGKNNFTWKNPTMAAAPGVGMPTPVTLKQALRRSCISHASEAAAMKKLPRPTGLSDFAEAGKIKKLYATVICQNEKSLSEEKRNLLEINGVPEKESIVVSSKTRIELKKPACMNRNTPKRKSRNGVVCNSEEVNDRTIHREDDTAASSKEELTPRKGHSCRSLEGKARAGGQKTREKGECSQSSKSSMGDRSSSTSISDDSNQSLSSGHGCKPHMSRDLRWTAIRLVEMNQGCIRLSNFKLLKRLGCGDIGTVYVAQLLGSSCLFALKVMDNDFLLSRKKMPRAQTEREILQILDHPFLPTLYAHFTADNLSCLVMEYCPGGDLHVLRQKQPLRSFPEPAARFYVAEVLLALEYLHMLGVIYRDLKPENILVREDGHIMLSDFDLSLRCSVLPVLLRSPPSAAADADDMPSAACADPLCRVSCLAVAGGGRSRDRADALPMMVAEPAEARSNSFVGTHEYLAPEIIKGEGHGSSVDWWTLGIFLYELLFGRTPFKGGRDEETLMNIVAQDLCFPESTAVTAQARDLIWGLLVKDPAGRLGAVRGATEIKRHPFFDGLNWALIRCTIPPETPTSDDIVLPRPPTTAPAPVPQPAVVGRKKTARCLNFGDEEVKFALF